MELKRRYHFGDLGINERVMLKWILKKYSLRMWTDSSDSGQCPVA
jgi:hypothetical protein